MTPSTLPDLLPAIVWRGDLRGRFTWVSDAARAWLGYPTEQWLEPSFWATHLHPDDAARVLELRAEKAAAGLAHACEYRMIAADGRVVWLRDSASVEQADGRPMRTQGVMVDVTDRPPEMLDALRASEERYRFLYQRTPAMMHSIDHQGRIVDVSDAWLQRLGYTRQEVLGRRSVDFLTPASREYAQEVVLPEYFRTGVTRDAAYQFVRKDGQVLDILLSAVAERYPGGRFERSLAVLVDVTERKRTEEALRRSEAQLLQAQKMEAIGRLAGGVAHDFNNLLVVILGHAEMLLEKVVDPALRVSVESIARAGDSAAALTRQILTFSRQQVVQPRVLDLNDVIHDIEKLLRRLIREDIALVNDLQPSLGRVRVDPGQAAQVLMNLCVNASDAMPRGGRLVIETSDVTLDATGPCEPGPYVLLAVTDTGVGMDAETQARIFEPFFTTKELGRGTGLGLAIVYGVVRQSGGCITVYSEPGRGTSFRLYLPRVEAVADAGEATVGPSTSLAGCGIVLVVEDDDLVRAIVADMLRGKGYTPMVAPDADEAIRLVEAHPGPIDVVLTDVVMPGTTCETLVARVRARHPRARVFYMSGYAGAERPPMDPDGFLQKPFTMNALLRKLRAVPGS